MSCMQREEAKVVFSLPLKKPVLWNEDGAFPRAIWAHPALLLGKDFLKDDSRHPAFLPQLQKQPDGQAMDAAMWVPPGVHLPVTAPAASQMLLGAVVGNASLQPQLSPKARQMPLVFALRNQMAVHAPSSCVACKSEFCPGAPDQ